MSEQWFGGNKDSNPVVSDLFRSFTNSALGQLRSFIGDETSQSNSGGILFDTDNVGGYLSIETTGNTAFIVDGDSSGTWSVKDKLVGDFMLYVEPGSRDVWMRGLPSFTIDESGQLEVNNHLGLRIVQINEDGGFIVNSNAQVGPGYADQAAITLNTTYDNTESGGANGYIAIKTQYTGDIHIYSGMQADGNGGSITIRSYNGGSVNLDGDAGIFLSLPTSAGATGSLWNDGGTVKVA